MFFWRFVHNSLPVRNNLKRSSKTETICSMCNRFDEDCDHLFFIAKGQGVLAVHACGGGAVQSGEGSSSKDMGNVTGSSTENCGMALEVVDGEE